MCRIFRKYLMNWTKWVMYTTVIVTRGHKHDADVLEEALKRPSKYIGMIGSKRKIKMVYDYLMAKGVPSEQPWRRCTRR